MNTKYREKRGRIRERKKKKIKTVVCLQWWWNENQLRDKVVVNIKTAIRKYEDET